MAIKKFLVRNLKSKALVSGTHPSPVIWPQPSFVTFLSLLFPCFQKGKQGSNSWQGLSKFEMSNAYKGLCLLPVVYRVPLSVKNLKVKKKSHIIPQVNFTLYTKTVIHRLLCGVIIKVLCQGAMKWFDKLKISMRTKIWYKCKNDFSNFTVRFVFFCIYLYMQECSLE